MENLPIYIPVSFMITTAVVTWLLYRAAENSKFILLLALLWLVGQSVLALSGFYTVTNTLPPRLLLLVLPPLLIIVAIFSTGRGRAYVDRLDSSILTLLHMLRVPVELVLFWLYLNRGVPELMTFEGRNFDILAGLSAPFIYYFGYRRHRLHKNVLIGWNLVCLALLFNIVTHGILSAPTPFQQFGFEQPNVALLYFPYVLLPGFIVPMVLFSHLVAIRQLLLNKVNTADKAVADTVTPVYS